MLPTKKAVATERAAKKRLPGLKEKAVATKRAAKKRQTAL